MVDLPGAKLCSNRSFTLRAAGPGARIVRASVERGRQPPPVLHGKRVFLAQLAEEADHQAADPLTLLGFRPFQLLEQEGESALAIAVVESVHNVGPDPLCARDHSGRNRMSTSIAMSPAAETTQNSSDQAALAQRSGAGVEPTQRGAATPHRF
jgi:hypothetical protein